MKKFQIRCTKDNGDYIILEEKLNNFGNIKQMFQWYEAHASFFNGQLSIEEVEV